MPLPEAPKEINGWTTKKRFPEPLDTLKEMGPRPPTQDLLLLTPRPMATLDPVQELDTKTTSPRPDTHGISMWTRREELSKCPTIGFPMIKMRTTPWQGLLAMERAQLEAIDMTDLRLPGAKRQLTPKQPSIMNTNK